MTLSDDLSALLVGLLLAFSVADAGFPGVAFPTGAGHFGARLSPRSYNVHNSYSDTPYGGHYGNVAGNYNNIGSSHNNIGSSHNNIGSSHNIGSNYNSIGGNHNIGGNYNNNIGGNYNSNGGNYNNNGGNYNNNGGNNYNNGGNYNGGHSVYMRNNGRVAQNGYTVNTATSALRAQSVHAVRSADYHDNQNDNIGEYGDRDDSSRFQYQYQVSDPLTGDSKSKHETRDGDAVTGEYRVLEANGLMRIVSYTADDAHGFVARVRWVPAERPHGAAVSHQEVTQQQSH